MFSLIARIAIVSWVFLELGRQVMNLAGYINIRGKRIQITPYTVQDFKKDLKDKSIKEKDLTEVLNIFQSAVDYHQHGNYAAALSEYRKLRPFESTSKKKTDFKDLSSSLSHNWWLLTPRNAEFIIAELRNETFSEDWSGQFDKAVQAQTSGDYDAAVSAYLVLGHPPSKKGGTIDLLKRSKFYRHNLKLFEPKDEGALADEFAGQNMDRTWLATFKRAVAWHKVGNFSEAEREYNKLRDIRLGPGQVYNLADHSKVFQYNLSVLGYNRLSS